MRKEIIGIVNDKNAKHVFIIDYLPGEWYYLITLK